MTGAFGMAAKLDGMIQCRGQQVVVRRQITITPVTFQSVFVRAVAKPTGTGDLADTQRQGSWTVIIADTALTAAGYPVPLAINDEIVLADGWTGRILRVTDPGPKGVGDAIVGYWATCEG